MSTALYRRYRPDSFAEMIGQEHVTQPLMQALRSNRVNHAYLFSGPRGCGKTTSARILARILNCARNTEASPTDTPCGECPSCVELARGGSGSLDVVEIDAASHGGVDDARDLRERATFSPTRDRFKIFILDEAHMVTAQGFNALLKIVEEPPAYLKFIFATTEPEKVIGTIRSRTHHYPFKLVAPEVMHQYLVQLCQAEGIDAAQGVLQLVVRAGGGSVRDTLSVLDQLIAGASGGQLTYDHAVGLLGFTPATLLDDVVDGLAARDGAALFRVVEQVVSTGHEPRRFVEDVLERLRDLIVVSLSGERAASVLSGVPADQFARMQGQAGLLGAGELSRSADIVNAALTEMSGATSPRLHLELLCARLLLPAADGSASGLAARIDGLERAVSSGVAIAGGGSGSAPRSVAVTGTGESSGAEQTGASAHVASGPTHSVSPVGAVAPGGGHGGVGGVGGVASGERKSLRPDSTRRKPAADTETGAPSKQVQSGVGAVQSGVGGSIFASPAASGAPISTGAPASAGASASTGASATHDPSAVQGSQGSQTAQDSAVGQAGAPGANAIAPQTQQAPLAQTTGWHPYNANPVGAPSTPVATSPVGPAAVGAEEAPTEPSRSTLQTAPPVQAAPSVQVAPQVQDTPPAQATTAQAPTAQAPAEQVTEAKPSGGGVDQTATFALRWPEVLEAFGARHRAAGAFAKQFAAVEHLDATTLYVSLPSPNLVANLTGRGGEQGLADAVKETLGFDVAVVIDVAGSDRFPKVGSSAGQPVAAPTQVTARPDNTTLTQPTGTGHAATADALAAQPADFAPDEPGHFDTYPPDESEDHWGDPSEPEAHGSAQREALTQPATAVEPATAAQPTAPVQPAAPAAPAPAFDPLASVNVFGAAIDALASARHLDTPELPSLGAINRELTQQWQQGTTGAGSPNAENLQQASENPWDNAASVEAGNHVSSELAAYSPASGAEASSAYNATSHVQQANTQQETAHAMATELHGSEGHVGLSQPDSFAHSSNNASTVDAERDATPRSAATPPVAHTPAETQATVPPWEETPRQAAARLAKEKLARDAQRATVIDDPQPDDEDFDSSNLVGIPLVMKMFGATIIEERVVEA